MALLPHLPGGLVVGNFCVQVFPSQTHVSPTTVPQPVKSSTTCWRALSYAMGAPGEGGLWVGNFCVQVGSCASVGETTARKIIVKNPQVFICHLRKGDRSRGVWLSQAFWDPGPTWV